LYSNQLEKQSGTDPDVTAIIKDQGVLLAGVQVLKNNFDDAANALVTFVGPQEVAIYNSTVLFLREVDPELAFIALVNGVNATLTRTNFFDNSGKRSSAAPSVQRDNMLVRTHYRVCGQACCTLCILSSASAVAGVHGCLEVKS
jgi:hypothetical protein